MPQTKEFEKKYLDHLEKQMEDMKKYLKQVSEILEKKTYLQGGWPEEFWLYIKKHLQDEIASQEKLIEFLEKTKR
jgi:ABC-type Fe3+-hydroxamate transport system substrate-binding protein